MSDDIFAPLHSNIPKEVRDKMIEAMDKVNLPPAARQSLLQGLLTPYINFRDDLDRRYKIYRDEMDLERARIAARNT